MRLNQYDLFPFFFSHFAKHTGGGFCRLTGLPLCGVRRRLSDAVEFRFQSRGVLLQGRRGRLVGLQLGCQPGVLSLLRREVLLELCEGLLGLRSGPAVERLVRQGGNGG